MQPGPIRSALDMMYYRTRELKTIQINPIYLLACLGDVLRTLATGLRIKSWTNHISAETTAHDTHVNNTVGCQTSTAGRDISSQLFSLIVFVVLFVLFVCLGDPGAGGGGDGGGEPAGRPSPDSAHHHEQVSGSGGGKRPALPTVYGRDHC